MLMHLPDIDAYVQKFDFEKQVAEFTLDPELLAATDKTGRTPTAGDVKMFYYTKSGPGPQKLSVEESNLDPQTGLNTHHP